MPLPKPNKGEAKPSFIDRCAGDPVMNKEYPDNDQRLAICHSQWKRKKKRNEAMKNYEVRVLPISESKWEIRKEGDKPKLVGYAAVFNKPSEDLGGFTERIAPGAFVKALKSSDARALFNHDQNYVLGRESAGTLKMKEDDKGLHVEINPPDAQWARDLMESVRRGDIAEQSFAFRVAKDEWKNDDVKKTTERTIVEVERIRDVSIVTYPAYPDTSIALRSLDTWKAAQKPEVKSEPPKPTVDVEVLRRNVELKQKLILIDKE